MSSKIRQLILALAVVMVLVGASATNADTLQVTLGGGLSGVLDLTVTPDGPGTYLVTKLTGTEVIGGATFLVGALLPTNSSGVYWFPPPAGGFTYDNLIFPGSSTVFDNGGLLFTLIGGGGSVFENLYSVGTASYLQSAYLNNGAPFPLDFSSTPVTVSVSKLVVATPEPSSLILCIAGMLLGAAFLFKKSLMS
jgi:hypothetical protein